MMTQTFRSSASLVLVAFLLFATACSNKLGDLPTHTPSNDEVAVAISTRINHNNFTLKSESNDHATWTPLSKVALSYEEKVYHAVLYVYLGETLHKTLIFYTPEYDATGTLAALGTDKARPLQYDAAQKEFTMSVELRPAYYTFLIVANSEKALEQAKQGTNINPSAILYSSADETKVFTSYDLDPANGTGGIPKRMLPMVGQSYLSVPSGATGTQASPTKLSPSIGLERLHARVDISLSTTTDNTKANYNSAIEQAQYKPEMFRLKEVRFRGFGGYSYPLLPLRGEHTANAEAKLFTTASVSALTAAAPATAVEGLLNTDAGYQQKGINQEAGKGVAKIWEYPVLHHTSTTWAPQSGDALHLYIPPLYRAGDKNTTPQFVPEFDIVFTDLLNGNEKIYTLQLHNGTNNNASDHWSIRRNTIYYFGLQFYGDKLKSADYVVDPWTSVGVDLPW